MSMIDVGELLYKLMQVAREVAGNPRVVSAVLPQETVCDCYESGGLPMAFQVGSNNNDFIVGATLGDEGIKEISFTFPEESVVRGVRMKYFGEDASRPCFINEKGVWRMLHAGSYCTFDAAMLAMKEEPFQGLVGRDGNLIIYQQETEAGKGGTKWVLMKSI